MRRLMLAVTLASLAACGDGAAPTLVLYSGRSSSLVDDIVERFERETGIDVKLKYAGTPELAQILIEEGDASPADLFWAQDAGSLGVVAKRGLFVDLPKLDAHVPAKFRHAGGRWVATSCRARVLAYAPARVKPEELPASVLELTDPKWKGRIGWAPSNASFQSFVTGFRRVAGDDAARRWLEGMIANDAVKYPKNTPIIKALAAGEIDLGLPNHYYVLREKKADPAYPVEQTFFTNGDIGNLANVAGIGILKTGKNREAAERFVAFLLSDAIQATFVGELHEYPVVEGVAVESPFLVPLDDLLERAPDVDLNDLDDDAATTAMLKDLGLIG